METQPHPINIVPQQNSNPTPKTPTVIYDRQERVMNQLKATLLARINPSIAITPQLNTHIEQRLQQFFPTFHTPTHPAYASMIRRAIAELNDGKGSTEEEISAFIKREHLDLPWGHESFLSHHLRKLCCNKDIVSIDGGRYVLFVKDCDFKAVEGPSRKSLGRRGRQCRKQHKVKRKKKQCQPKNQQSAVFEETRDLMKGQHIMTEGKIEPSGKPEKDEKNQQIQSDVENMEIEKTERQIEETPHAMELKQQKDQITTLDRDMEQIIFNKQEECQALVTTTNAFDMCVESVKKTKRFEEQTLEVSLSFKGTEESKSNRGKGKECLQDDQHMQTQTSCVVMKSNFEVIDGENKCHNLEKVIRDQSHRLGHHIGAGSKVGGSCCDGKGDVGVRLIVPCPEEQLQIKSPCDGRELVFGLSAQNQPRPKNLSGKRKAAKLHTDPDLSSMVISCKPITRSSKNIIMLSASDSQHQHELQPPRQRCRGRPPRLKPDTNMVIKSLLPSNDDGCQLVDQGNGQRQGLNLVAEATTSLSLCTHDQQQPQSCRRGRRPGRKRNRKRY